MQHVHIHVWSFRNAPVDDLLPDGWGVTVVENGEGTADLGLAEEEDGVAVHEGEELLHQVQVEEELLLNVAFVVRGHLVLSDCASLGRLHVSRRSAFPKRLQSTNTAAFFG